MGIPSDVWILPNGFEQLQTIEDVYLLGSSFVDNYYTNLIFFLPRLFFNNEDEIKPI